MLERILETFELSIEEFLEGIDKGEIRKNLNSLPQVSGHLQRLQESSQRRKRRWLISSALCCVLGISTLVPTMFGMGMQITVYDYTSVEIVPKGENGESFQSLDAFLEREFIEIRADILSRNLDQETRDETMDFAWDDLKARYASLAIPTQASDYEYRGQSFIEPIVEGQDLINLQATNLAFGGTRTFELYDTRSLMQEEMRSANFGLGIFFLALGVFGFILERLLRSKE